MKGILLPAISAMIVGLLPLASAVDLTTLTPDKRAEYIKECKVDAMAFDNEPLLDCLKSLSDYAKKATGMGFSIIDQSSGKLGIRITMKISDLSISETLRYLGQLSDARIELTPQGCLVKSTK